MEELSIQIINIVFMVTALFFVASCCVRMYVDLMFYDWPKWSKWTEIKKIVYMVFVAYGTGLVRSCLGQMGYGEQDYLFSIYILIFVAAICYSVCSGLTLHTYKRMIALVLQKLAYSAVIVALANISYDLKYFVTTNDWIWEFTEQFLVYVLCAKAVIGIWEKINNEGLVAWKAVKENISAVAVKKDSNNDSEKITDSE